MKISVEDTATMNEKSVLYVQDTIDLISKITYSKSVDLAKHSREVSQIARVILKNIDFKKVSISGIEESVFKNIDLDTLSYIYEVHDLGKLRISEKILNKPFALTKDEYNQIKLHPLYGKQILIELMLLKKNLTKYEGEFYKAALCVITEHHENYNGTGYPFGKKGTEISLLGRVAKVADVISALMGTRCYNKNPFTLLETLNYLKKNKSILFDPYIADTAIVYKYQIEEVFSSSCVLDDILKKIR